MTTWYRAWNEDVTPVEVERFTDKCVWIEGQRSLRDSWQSYFPTAEEAWDRLITEKQGKVDLAKTSLMYRESELERVKTKRAKALLAA